MANLNQLLKYFYSVCGNSQYVQYVRNIDVANGQRTVAWIDEVIQQKGTLADTLKKYDDLVVSNPNNWAPKTIKNYKAGYKNFAEVVLGLFSANTWLTRDNGKKKTSLFLCQLVADNAIFASQTIVNDVINGRSGSKDNLKKGNKYASWDRLKHVRKIGVKKGTLIPDLTPLGNTFGDMIADDNTIANQALKKAIILSFNRAAFGPLQISSYADRFKDYEVCHIWDLPEDRRYYASIANLVLLPRAIAGLSDHSVDVKSLLRYEAFNRFGFKPDGEPAPPKPSCYSKITWRYIFK